MKDQRHHPEFRNRFDGEERERRKERQREAEERAFVAEYGEIIRAPRHPEPIRGTITAEHSFEDECIHIRYRGQLLKIGRDERIERRHTDIHRSVEAWARVIDNHYKIVYKGRRIR